MSLVDAQDGRGRSVSDPVHGSSGGDSGQATAGQVGRGGPRRMSTFQMLTHQMSSVIDTVGDKVRKSSGMAAEAAISASEADRKRRGLNRSTSVPCPKPQTLP